MDFPRRTFDGEGVKADVDFGPTLMLNRNRCILCTRCIRFMARSRRRRADRHHQSRQRQRDRDLQRAGRALDPVGQPDGRLPGRRDHHAAVSLPLAAVGQPARRRHHLHAVLEGLQHHRVAQGQAGMGQGRAPDARHAALQPAGQRLLDVRHRPLPVPVGRRRAAPAQAADQHQGRRAAGRDLEGRADARARSAECRRPQGSGVGAHARLGARVARRAVPAEAPRRGSQGRRRRVARARRVAAHREAAAGRTPSSACRRSMRRTSTARRISASPSSATADGDADLSALRTAIDQDRVAVLYVRRSRTRRIAGRRVVGDRGAQERPPAGPRSTRACCRPSSSKIADVVLPGAAWVEKDATYTNDQGMVQAASKAINAPGEVGRRLADPHQRRRGARPALHLHDLAAGARRRGARTCRRHARIRDARPRRSSTARSAPSTGSRPATRWNAGSGTRCSRTCRR